MARANNIRSLGSVERFADAVKELQSPGDYVEIVRGVPRALVMSCPDGCGETLTINLDGRAGPAWRKYVRNTRLTVYPSVWRESGCRAHFIIWQNRIIWCGPRDEATVALDDKELLAIVLAHLSTKVFTHYEEVAEITGQIPWEVYWACRDLARAGTILEGKRGTYKKV